MRELQNAQDKLGSMLLDEFLREFDNAAERDIWWSIPSYLKDNYNSDWRAYTELDFESIKLYNTDKHTAAPLALVWSLSSVNNSVRQSSRYKLTAWGISNPLEFWKLFEKCISIDDVQVLEDIFAVSFGIALDQFICDEYLLIASKWFVENLFSNEGLKKYENVALRYYGAGVVKTAISHGLMDAGLRQLVTPPYSYDPDYLPLCRDALDSNRMGGYQAIDYDLARYVLCDRWISAGAVKKNDFQQLLILLDNYCEDRNELLNVCDFHSYQDCRCYCTPQEACLVHSEREINSVLSIGKDNSKIEIFKLVEECLSADEMETERYYTFPSKLTRGLTGIVYGDGFSYSDKRGNVIARYSDSGEKWGTFQQTLMINYDRLMSGLTEAELMPVWLFRLYREPSPKARERFDNLMHSSDKTFMVWQEGNQFRFKELLPLEPERND